MSRITARPDEGSIEDYCRLRDRAIAMIKAMREDGMVATDAVFVLMLALASFVAAGPEEDRQGALDHVTRMLADMVPHAGCTCQPRFDA